MKQNGSTSPGNGGLVPSLDQVTRRFTGFMGSLELWEAIEDRGPLSPPGYDGA